MVKPRRSPAQVAADKKRMMDQKHNIEKLAQKNIDTLAQMVVQQEIEDEEEEARVIQRLSDIDMLVDPETMSGSAEENLGSADSGNSDGADGYGGDTEPASDAEEGIDADTDISSDMEAEPAQKAPVKTNVSWSPSPFL
jgi:hypothetical protein